VRSWSTLIQAGDRTPDIESLSACNGSPPEVHDHVSVDAKGECAMTRRYDVVVIGSGTAASTVASRCRAAGWTIAVIDSRPFGGTCSLRGCDPKKILVGATEAIECAG
jgi:ribulose 1,5-bisphosphate synthetase/thiazole synthase